MGRTPYGVRGLKCLYKIDRRAFAKCRTPYGVRGLKCRRVHGHSGQLMSHPLWGAWIEISDGRTAIWVQRVAPLMGCVD